MQPLVKAVGYFLGALLILAGLLTASSLVFSAAWNCGVASVWGLPTLSPVESLSALSCLWIASFFAKASR